MKQGARVTTLVIALTDIRAILSAEKRYAARGELENVSDTLDALFILADEALRQASGAAGGNTCLKDAARNVRKP